MGLFDGFACHETEFRLGDEIVPNLPPSSALERDCCSRTYSGCKRTTASPGGLGLEEESETVLEGAGWERWAWPSFTVEMETGTGKTYVYLWTILELRKRYGFGKIIVVVPCVAIYEGVVKVDITKAALPQSGGSRCVHLDRPGPAQQPGDGGGGVHFGGNRASPPAHEMHQFHRIAIGQPGLG